MLTANDGTRDLIESFCFSNGSYSWKKRKLMENLSLIEQAVVTEIVAMIGTAVMTETAALTETVKVIKTATVMAEMTVAVITAVVVKAMTVMINSFKNIFKISQVVGYKETEKMVEDWKSEMVDRK